MALPLTRNRTYIANVTPVASQDMNELQDYLIMALRGGSPVTRTKIVGPELFNRQSGFTIPATFPYAELLASTAGVLYIPLPVIVGEVVSQVRLVSSALGNGATCVVTDITCSLRSVNCASGAAQPGTETNISGTINLPTTAITTQKTVISAGGPYTIAVDKHYYIRCNGANSVGNKAVMRVEYDYTVP